MEPNKSNIIIYQTEDGQTRIEVRMEEETVWLSQQQLSDLYQTSRPREPMWWNTSNIFMKKENQMKYQPVGNSDRFECKKQVMSAITKRWIKRPKNTTNSKYAHCHLSNRNI